MSAFSYCVTYEYEGNRFDQMADTFDEACSVASQKLEGGAADVRIWAQTLGSDGWRFLTRMWLDENGEIQRAPA